MNVRRLLVTASVAGLTAISAQTAVAFADVPTGSSGTGSSALDTGSAATGSAGLTQTGSAGGTFDNCDQARAAGKAPLFRGEPGYSPHLDPDGTGMACPTV
ncbi:excalibur calcium-binding domain-containing protein [Nocardia sp. NBC_00511]|uniref:excalibur calcium-binding domain-containing protein n=1 Tax=Nocardia sp. NBC_00511 TaxID=2903591 RepID=UPI0030E2F518